MRNERGMTLIEVLVALAIVAITMSAGIRAAGGLTTNAQRLSDLTLGQWCAENKLQTLRMTKTFPPVGDSDFGCEQMGLQFQGHLRVRPTNNPSFRRADVRILDEQSLPVVTLSTVLWRH
jgi:general secretion pathway protein I